MNEKETKGIRTPEHGENMRKWREEHGYTTPEWEMYSRELAFKNTVTFFLGMISGGVIVRVIQGVLYGI